MPPTYLLLTYWGARFSDYLCRYALPSLLAKNNIPALEQIDRCRFIIATTQEDWEALQERQIFRVLKDHIAVELLPCPTHDGEHKYVRLSRGHAVLAQRCFEEKAIGMIVGPDAIYPDGFVAEAHRLWKLGRKVILNAGTRFVMEAVDRELSDRGLLREGRPFSLSKRDAVGIGLRNVHPEPQAGHWSSPNFGRLNEAHGRRYFLTWCHWKVPGETGLILITHNWDPVLIDYSTLSHHDVTHLDGQGVDGAYTFDNFGETGIGSRVYVVDDSDSIFVLALTPGTELLPPVGRKWWRDLRPVRDWSRGYILNRTVFDPGIDPLRRQIYRIPVRWHADDTGPAWDDTEQEVARAIRKYVASDLCSRNGATATGPVERLWHRALPFVMRRW